MHRVQLTSPSYRCEPRLSYSGMSKDGKDKATDLVKSVCNQSATLSSHIDLQRLSFASHVGNR